MHKITYTADPRVDAYINALPDWQQAICRQVRELVHASALSAMFKQMIANNRLGGWRKLKRQGQTRGTN